MNTLKKVLRQAGFEGHGLAVAYAVAMASSGGHTDAHNPDPGANTYGLFQISMDGPKGKANRLIQGLTSNNQLYDALTNARVAFRLSNGGTDWHGWNTYTSGAYKAFMGPGDHPITHEGIPPTQALIDTGQMSFGPQAPQISEQDDPLAELVSQVNQAAGTNLPLPSTKDVQALAESEVPETGKEATGGGQSQTPEVPTDQLPGA